MMRHLKWSVFLTITLVSCNMQQLLWPERRASVAPSVYSNPHSDCTFCHGTKETKPDSPQFNAEPSSLCFDCHDYQKNHHPVDFRPTDYVEFPLPLYDGMVRCLTCHEIHGGPDHTGSPRLLRGGPYLLDRREMCSKCHSWERYTAINPHIMLESDGAVRQVNGQPVCLLCHAVKPNPEIDTTEDVKFKADVGFLCWRCHPPMPGEFFNWHFHVTPSPKTLKYIQETEESLNVILPLVPRGRITCSTCHNPHQKGVIWREAAAKGADAIMKLRFPSMCHRCHNM